jgi:hypothetical protein
MSTFFNLKSLNRKRLNSVLGLTLEDSRLECVVLRRANGSARAQQSLSVSLSLDPLTADAELVGRELRNHLDAADIHERYCVVGLPLKWVLSAHAEVPKMPEADIQSFLQLEAERGFPCDVSTLFTAISRCRLPSGKEHATLAGVPRNHLARLEQVLRAAKLKPVRFSLGTVALQPPVPEVPKGILALVIGETQVALQITCGGGVAALRTLEGALENEAGRRTLLPAVVAREVRITLGQLPAEVRDSLHDVRIFGPRDLAQQLADELELRFEASGLKVEIVSRYAANEFGFQLPEDAPVSAAFSLAASRLAGRAAAFELLPPRVLPWRQVMNRYSSGKFGFAGAAAGAAALLVAGAFLFQQWQLTSLRSKWSAIAPQVHQTESIQAQIRQFRPWFDTADRDLTILRQITAAFPEDGVVSAKTIEIREEVDREQRRGITAVTCTGQARDNVSLRKTLDRLRATGGVSEFKMGQIRGKSPLQFAFDFHWNPGGKGEN